ncbi:MAG TPA: family 16 glycoside hydrolase [Candidatus Bathyarchaeia archaeon]|nr:family 16 glycoside hydrolase [Candidatus Bathyarchaeia archaeon]
MVYAVDVLVYRNHVGLTNRREEKGGQNGMSHFQDIEMLVRYLPLAIFLAVLFLAVTPMPGHAQSLEEEVLYEENFNDNLAQEWQLEPGWTVTEEGVLRGEGHSWARYKEVDWQDFRVQIQLRIVEEGSRIHLNYRVSNEGRYYIGFHADGLYLSKEAPGGTFYENLSSSSWQYSKYEWHSVEIVVEGSRIQVFVDGTQALNYNDPEPLLSGTIAFETLEGTVVQVDDIVVTGQRPVTPEYPDLIVAMVNSEIVEETLIIVAAVENAGEAPVEEGFIIVTAEAPGWSGDAGVPELGVGEIAEVTINLNIRDELREQWHSFDVIVDSEYELVESNEENNRQTIRIWVPGIEVPPSTTTPTPTPEPAEEPEEPGFEMPPPAELEHPNHELIILIVIVLSAVGGTALTIRRIIEIRSRKEWQEKAEEEEPRETCEPCTHHCRKIKLEPKPALRKIVYFNLRAYDPSSGEESNEWQVKGTVVDGLNKAVTAHRRRAQPEKLQDHVAHLAHAFLQQIMERLQDEPTPRDLAIVGHLEGGKFTCQFTLYHCNRRGTENIWEEKAKWTAKIKDEHDEPVGTLRGLNPTEPEIPEQLTAELIRLLIQFIEKI